MLKASRVTPIYKGGDRGNLSNYRPISVLPVMAKILEGVAAQQLTRFMQDNSILTPCQYGFRPQSSTQSAVFDLVSNIQAARDVGHCAIAVYIDVRKAFDAVDHACLGRRLAECGILGTAREWFTDYLDNRTQIISYEDLQSQEALCGAGVPQGSRLGPILFTLFINSLEREDLAAKVFMYADDICLLYSGENTSKLAMNANSDLSKILTWSNGNKITINSEKTKYTVFGRQDGLVEIFLDRKKLEEVETFKYLGIIIDNKLNFEPHIQDLRRRLSAISGALRRGITRGVSLTTRRALYFAMCQSILSYGAVIWGPCAASDNLAKLQRSQNKCIKTLFQLDSRTSSSYLYGQFNLTNVDRIIKFQQVIFVFKVLNNLLHSGQLIQTLQHNRNTRNINSLQNIKPNTTRFGLKSIKFSAINAYNKSLIKNPKLNEIKELNSFKKHVIETIK